MNRTNETPQPMVRYARTVEDVDKLLQPGVIVEVEPELAERLGACRDETISVDEALAAMHDSATYGDDWQEETVER